MRKQDTSKALAPHLEEIARAIRQRIDGKKEGWGTPNFVVRRTVTRLTNLAGTRRLNSHSETFKRAIAELQGRELPRASQRREVEGTVRVIAEWLDLETILPPVAPKQKKALPPPERVKGIRRFKVNGNWLEEYGIEMGDRLLVAMTGDVQPGEVAYVCIKSPWGPTGHQTHKAFHFIHDVDGTCIEWAREEGGTVCLRNYGDKCMGNHAGEGCRKDAFALGRVVGAERDRVPLEHTLPVRPFDERELPEVERTAKAAADWLEEELKRPPEKSAAKPTAESHAEQTKRELFEKWRGNALAFAVQSARAFPFAPAVVSDENFARYNIRKGDTLKITLDGDAEPGELAYVTWYDLDDKARYWTYGFLFIEGDHFCIRGESHLECDDDHHTAECMTIIGRVAAVERGGLPVRLKGLELRGLPYAEDLPRAVEKEED